MCTYSMHYAHTEKEGLETLDYVLYLAQKHEGHMLAMSEQVDLKSVVSSQQTSMTICCSVWLLGWRVANVGDFLVSPQ